MSMSSSYFFGVRAFDRGVRVESDSEEMCDSLNRFVLPPLQRCAIPSCGADIRIAVRKGPCGFDVLVDEEKISAAETVSDAALAAVKALDDALVRKLGSLRAVHAGAVALKGRALLIPGSSHAGKSSLVAELLRAGAVHLSDEYALIDDVGRVHGYPRPLLLRNGSPKQTLTLPEELTSSFASEPVPVGWIVAVEYDSGAKWNIQPISQGEAVMLLLRNTPHEMGHSPEMIDLFTRCAAGAKCYTGVRGDVAEAAIEMMQLLAER